MLARVLVLVVVLAGCDHRAEPPKGQEQIMNSSPSTFVDKLPPQNGKGEGGRHESSGFFNFSGRYDKLNGCIIMRTIDVDILGRTANLKISVEQGKIRAYVGDPSGKEFRYIEATPGNPAQTRSDLIVQGGIYTFRLEAVDGEARGVSYHVWRS
ncbi:MAG TPA: hypothetical protein VKE22_28165 [Haliangiales bacterium]|nr:hypothetical protein [Haliangiales bacterium]